MKNYLILTLIPLLANILVYGQEKEFSQLSSNKQIEYVLEKADSLKVNPKLRLKLLQEAYSNTPNDIIWAQKWQLEELIGHSYFLLREAENSQRYYQACLKVALVQEDISK